MLTHDEIKALALLIALALLGAGIAHLDARHPEILSLTLGDSLRLGRASSAAENSVVPEPVAASSGGMQSESRRAAGSPTDAHADSIARAETSGASVDVTGRMNVNVATAAELELLPGVGPKMAERIVEERKRNGPFKRPRDLRRVKGIGEKTLARLLPYVRTDSATESAP
jgi:competence ComEA-like helix-hairpin-helix protein